MRSLFSLSALFFLFQNTLAAQSAPFQLIYGSDDSQEVAVGSIQLADGSIFMILQSGTLAGAPQPFKGRACAGQVVQRS